MKIWDIQTWDLTKSALKGKFTAINVHIKRKERLRINDLSFYFKKLRKEEQTKLKESRKEKIIRIKAKTNETESKHAIKRINKTRSCFFEKTKFIKPIAWLTKKKRGSETLLS